MNLEPFPADEQAAKLKKGMVFSWLSLAILPLGSFFGMLGICPGPDSTGSAAIVLVLGVAGLAAAGYGAVRVVRSIRHGSPLLKIGGVLSLGASLLAALFGAVFAVSASDALNFYLRGR